MKRIVILLVLLMLTACNVPNKSVVSVKTEKTLAPAVSKAEEVPKAKPTPTSPPTSTPTPTKAVKSVKATAVPTATHAPIPTKEPTLEPTLKPTEAPVIVEQSVVTISIIGVDDKVNILPPTAVNFIEGISVFDVLLEVTKANKIQMEFSGTKSTAYIKGIDNLYEFDKGELSGWIYSVNGKTSSKSCGAYKLKKGDVIEWKYTKEGTQEAN